MLSNEELQAAVDAAKATADATQARLEAKVARGEEVTAYEADCHRNEMNYYYRGVTLLRERGL